MLNILLSHCYLASVTVENAMPRQFLGEDTIPNALTIVFGIIGGVSFIIVAYGGFTYATSQGDPEKLAKAKNTIIYALIGLVVSLMAYTITEFVIGALFG
jgi:hypothetical protein